MGQINWTCTKQKIVSTKKRVLSDRLDFVGLLPTFLSEQRSTVYVTNQFFWTLQ